MPRTLTKRQRLTLDRIRQNFIGPKEPVSILRATELAREQLGDDYEEVSSGRVSSARNSERWDEARRTTHGSDAAPLDDDPDYVTAAPRITRVPVIDGDDAPVSDAAPVLYPFGGNTDAGPKPASTDILTEEEFQSAIVRLLSQCVRHIEAINDDSAEIGLTVADRANTVRTTQGLIEGLIKNTERLRAEFEKTLEARHQDAAIEALEEMRKKWIGMVPFIARPDDSVASLSETIEFIESMEKVHARLNRANHRMEAAGEQ